jgi:hypothetical protein
MFEPGACGSATWTLVRMSPFGLITVPDPQPGDPTGPTTSLTVAASACRSTEADGPLAGAAGRRAKTPNVASPATAATTTPARAPRRIRPPRTRRPWLRAIWVLVSGGVMPISSPVAGSPSRSTTDSVMRSGPLSCLPSRNVPRRDWST